MVVHKGKRFTPRNFLPQGRLRAYSWHNRSLDMGLPNPHENAITKWDIDHYHPCDRERSNNTIRVNPQKLTPRGGASPELDVYHPYSFDPVRLDHDVMHTAPYSVSVIKRKRNNTDSNVEIRDMTDARYHRQGSLADILANQEKCWANIPGYTGFIRGKNAENVFGVGHASTNELSEIKCEKRRPPTETEYRQSTADFRSKLPNGTWQEQAYKRWQKATHGMTHQNRAPFGSGTEYRARIRVAEQLKKNQSDAHFDWSNTTLQTFAANKPIDVRTHNNWTKSIQGYGGHQPKWKDDKDFFEKVEVGKVYPPYCPEVTRYSTILQPNETPRHLNNLTAPLTPSTTRSQSVS